MCPPCHLCVSDVPMLERFLGLCKHPIIESSDVISSDRIVRKVYKKSTEGNMDYQIDALILPEDMIWPTFLETKQEEQRFKNIYFQRQTVLDANRRAYSLDLLCNKKKVIWTGAPGIGKSCDINHVLIELLSHLGQESWPSMVAFRVDTDLFTFTSSGVTRTQISYDDLHEYSKIHKHDNSVLVLELQESELDPVIRMPFILAVSTRNLDSKLKTLYKSAGRKFMLISPPEVEEVCLMTEAIMDVCPHNDLFKANTKEEAVSVVRSRALKVGAIPRYLFCDSDIFDSRLNEMIESASCALSQDLETLTITNIPKSAQYLVAPYLRYGVTNPIFAQKYETAASDFLKSCSKEDFKANITLSSLFSHEYRYLSEFAKSIHNSAVKGPNEIEAIKKLGFENQLGESLIRSETLIRQPSEKMNESINSERWEWHENVDYLTALSRKSLLPKDRIPVLRRRSAEVRFEGMYYQGDIGELNPDRLYRGTT